MALRIRLRRHGKKKQPVYRLVVAVSTSPRDGKYLETVGLYDPRKDPVQLSVNEERVAHWIGVGAKPSDTVTRLLASHGLVKPVVRQSSNQGVSRRDSQKAS